jgi:hypothetical protein
MMAAASVVVFTLASAPASAHHGHDIVGPAVAFIALSALFHHGHYQSHHRHHYGHYRPHHYKHRRRHSHSHGGYHKPRRKHYNH